MVFRKPDALIDSERDILEVVSGHSQGGIHGFALARELSEADGARRMVSHGTLYKALDRLRTRGFLSAEWEEQAAAEGSGRPRRRLYRITGEGARALATARAASPSSTGRLGEAAG